MIPAETSGIIISKANAHTHIMAIVVTNMFLIDVVPLILKKRDAKYHIKNMCANAKAFICHKNTPFAPIISPIAEQHSAIEICHGEIHNAEISSEVTGNAIL